MKSLKDYMPIDKDGEFKSCKAYKFKDVKVVEEIDGCIRKWIGKEKFVLNWVILENGFAVGWNENPARGWSFPIVKMK